MTSSNQYLFSQKDVNLLESHIEDIIKKARKRQMELIEPFEEEIKAVSKIIIDFVKQNKRKIYGGYALNQLVIEKNPDDAIYTEDDIPDIDFYSPEPLRDLVQLCNNIYDAGFKHVMGREALHKETYSIRVNNQLYCDISYVPKNIYNRMPFREINGLYVIGPEFMMIDYYRMLTDLTSYWRLDKAVKRFYLLQKYYPVPYIRNPLPVVTPDTNSKRLLNVIFKFIQNNDSVVVIGLYAYDHFLRYSNIMKDTNPSSRKFRYIEVPYYEFISSEYRKDAMNLIDQLKQVSPEITNDIHVIEHYPFFQYLGYSVNIYYGKSLIAKIYNNNKRCVPYITVKSDFFTNKSIEPGNNLINLGTYSTVILYILISIIKARVDHDKQTKDLYYTMLSHLTEMRNYYFEKTGKSVYEDSLFKEFVIDCKGIPVTPEVERQQLIEYRKRKNKRFIFSYDPAEGNRNEEFNYFFANSSGNPIKNIRNLRLTPEAKEEEVESEEESEEQLPNVNLV